MSEPLIALAMPSGGLIQHATTMCFARIAAGLVASGISILLPDQVASDICQARNAIVRGLLKADCTHVMWIDADQTFPADGVAKLLKHGLPAVGALYSSRQPPYRVVGVLKDADAYVRGGLQEADYLPGGFCLIETAVYRTMGDGPWYEERHDAAYATPENPYGFISDDVHFFRKAREQFGIQCWADLDLSAKIGHVGTRSMFIAPHLIGQRVDVGELVVTSA